MSYGDSLAIHFRGFQCQEVIENSEKANQMEFFFPAIWVEPHESEVKLSVVRLSQVVINE